MSSRTTPKIQPWKAMKTTEKDEDPDFGKLKNFLGTEPTCGSQGSSVHEPMSRRTGYGNLKKDAAVKSKVSQS